MPAEEKPVKQRKRPKSVRSVKRECKQKIIAEMDQIVTGLIEKAKRGSYNQAKLLLTIADKDERQKGGGQSGASGSRRLTGEVAAGAVGCVPEPAVPAKKRGGRRKTAGSSSKAGGGAAARVERRCRFSRSKRTNQQPARQT